MSSPIMLNVFMEWPTWGNDVSAYMGKSNLPRSFEFLTCHKDNPCGYEAITPSLHSIKDLPLVWGPDTIPCFMPTLAAAQVCSPAARHLCYGRMLGPGAEQELDVRMDAKISTVFPDAGKGGMVCRYLQTSKFKTQKCG